MEQINERELPVLATRNVVIYPGMTVPLNVGRAKSVAALERVRRADGYIITIAQKIDHSETEPRIEELYRVGTVCKVEKMRGSAQDGYQILLRGVSRVRVISVNDAGDCIVSRVDAFPDQVDLDDRTRASLVASIKSLARDILRLVPADTKQLEELIEGLDDINVLSYLCAEHLDAPLSAKQELLEMSLVKARSLKLIELMQSHKEGLKLQHEIRDRLSQKMGRMQRQAILREQLKAIKEELGERDEPDGGDDYMDKIDKAQMPSDARKIAVDEARRLASLGTNSPEAHVIRNYLDLLCAMPWNTATHDEIDLAQARQVLEADHYGLEPIKKRIIQHLAVLKLRNDGRGSILLFAGPPGVGKTSLGQSIAKALGRKFVRVALGGVRDDSEVRGHRRTYVGAMPGRIVQGIKRAGVNNPVFLLDEIDKLGRGYSGDPAAALLEVLDPEQNTGFVDHYLDTPFDLSKVFFIATANSLETIPGPLRDRMEVIELSGYTTAEKVHIAKNHLWQKQLEDHGVKQEQLKIKDDAVMRLITGYTREAGVRDLNRKISEVVRASTEKVLENQNGTAIEVDLAALEDTLGPDRFQSEVAQRLVPPGVVTGLAWTPVGGEILFIEASLMPGTGKLMLTGQLGDVMKESAQIALSLVRANMPQYVPGFDYDKKDIHVHVPAGAIPKDGPSAGVTMLTTLASLFSGRSVNPKLAMTGEITLRGAVMPVGGIKEKVIAAQRAGIEHVLLSKRNQKDLRDVPEEVKSQLRFDFVDTVNEVLKITLGIDTVPVTSDAAAAAQINVPSPTMVS